ncbi:MAG: hypothetical protein L3K03_02290 [Thermoplasmata archaeon]|nr:hypothetical protein [Thermoplasmata archaeon]
MTTSALSIGGFVGILLSGAFMYWQVGRYATPQVPETLFDERKEFIAYLVGLFAGVPLVIPLIFLLDSTSLVSALVDIALVVVGAEVIQWAAGRSVYFHREAFPFYALGIRAGMGGILALGIVDTFLSGSPTIEGGLYAAAQSVAVVFVIVAAGIASLPNRGEAPTWRTGSPVRGMLFAFLGLALLSFGEAVDPLTGTAGAGLAALGALWLYLQRRDKVLGSVVPPGADAKSLASSPFRRTN